MLSVYFEESVRRQAEVHRELEDKTHNSSSSAGYTVEESTYDPEDDDEE